MALLSRPALVAALAAIALLTAAAPGEAGSSCAFAGGGSGTSTLGDGPVSLFGGAPGGNALGITLGGLGAIAAFLAGGAVLGRRLGPSTAMELDNAIEAETVLLAEPAEIETEVALALRR